MVWGNDECEYYTCPSILISDEIYTLSLYRIDFFALCEWPLSSNINNVELYETIAESFFDIIVQ